jgi:hypothetical protein
VLHRIVYIIYKMVKKTEVWYNCTSAIQRVKLRQAYSYMQRAYMRKKIVFAKYKLCLWNHMHRTVINCGVIMVFKSERTQKLVLTHGMTRTKRSFKWIRRPRESTVLADDIWNLLSHFPKVLSVCVCAFFVCARHALSVSIWVTEHLTANSCAVCHWRP